MESVYLVHAGLSWHTPDNALSGSWEMSKDWAPANAKFCGIWVRTAFEKPAYAGPGQVDPPRLTSKWIPREPWRLITRHLIQLVGGENNPPFKILFGRGPPPRPTTKAPFLQRARSAVHTLSLTH